jgi:hypothetical protein
MRFTTYFFDFEVLGGKMNGTEENKLDFLPPIFPISRF